MRGYHDGRRDEAERFPLTRPHPPESVLAIGALPRFEPSLELRQWITSAYLDADGPLYTPEHDHLANAKIATLWTNAENVRKQRRVVGEAELGINIGGRQGAWQKARAEHQLIEWFGEIPDFLLTFDAFHAQSIDDASFCALVDHELFHCAQAEDEFGQPEFYRGSGLPKYCMRGHSVEEFTGVVRRFGIQAAGQEAVDLVIAAARQPEITAARLGRACGTCLAVAA